ncbi:hypothetical protein ANANG_G00154760 [Anguilla anguilla]|uniref:Fibronectin type-III domain-containing protein n=1 Tax=Anguilla anguilla TaxID=7936 RepID=A0A9D3M8W3_ANGAN|nr:hypothetical protein ANANG_G00154760 [Anguilla anguilla]
MSWSSITGLTCLLCCVVLSAGRVSPPQNLSVTFLDFRGEVNWSPGIGNPPGTTYTVEMLPIGSKSWSRLETCTDIESTTCHLNFNLTMNDLLDSYYIRVKASWGGNSSSWIGLDTVQPYGNTLLSAPTLNLSVQETDIFVHIRMPQLVLSVLPKLRYKVRVSEGASGDDEKCEMLRESSYVCKILSLGQRYCVRASAIHRQQQTKPHLSSVKCVDVPDNTTGLRKDILKHIGMATLALLLVIICIIITPMYIYMKPKASDLTPSSLKVVGGASRILMAIPAEAPSPLVRVITPSLRSGMTLQEYPSSCNCGYECRVPISCSVQTADFPLPAADEEELEEQHLSPCPYAGTLDEEVQGNDILEGETHSARLLSGERDWQLDRGPSCLDVPMTSLSLCLDSGEPWESCGESDSVSTEGEETDVGAKLLGQSQRNSAGDLSSSLETLAEPDPSSIYPTGYEPHFSPTSCEPNSSACSPSPTFGQSVLYLKR